jgi:hypothetical protein
MYSVLKQVEEEPKVGREKRMGRKVKWRNEVFGNDIS